MKINACKGTFTLHAEHSGADARVVWTAFSQHGTVAIITRHRGSTSTRWHFAFGLCCHSNETRVPIANPPNTVQLESTPTITASNIPVRAVVWECCEGQTQTHRRAWPIYISPRLRLTRNVISLVCFVYWSRIPFYLRPIYISVSC